VRTSAVIILPSPTRVKGCGTQVKPFDVRRARQLRVSLPKIDLCLIHPNIAGKDGFESTRGFVSGFVEMQPSLGFASLLVGKIFMRRLWMTALEKL
jgi:hypothetical protein